MRSMVLYRFAWDENGCSTDDRTYEWLRVHRRHSACFASLYAAVRHAKHAIRAALDAEADDQRLLFSEGSERVYDHTTATWSVSDFPEGVVTYRVPYRERTVEIDWASSTVKWGEWSKSDYPEEREIYIDKLPLTIFEDDDNPTDAGT